MAEAREFKFGTQLGFAKAHHKITPRGKSGRGHGLGKHPNIWGSPLIYLQQPRCFLSVSGASCLNNPKTQVFKTQFYSPAMHTTHTNNFTVRISTRLNSEYRKMDNRP